MTFNKAKTLYSKVFPHVIVFILTKIKENKGSSHEDERSSPSSQRSACKQKNVNIFY
jgi:hypothetical protein